MNSETGEIKDYSNLTESDRQSKKWRELKNGDVLQHAVYPELNFLVIAVDTSQNQVIARPIAESYAKELLMKRAEDAHNKLDTLLEETNKPIEE